MISSRVFRASAKINFTLDILGKREDISGEIFCEFSKKLINKGATIIGGCCETNISHIKEIAKLK